MYIMSIGRTKAFLQYKCICITYNSTPDVDIMSPQFNKTGFVSYSPVKGARYQMKLELEVKPQSLDDGIILYSGQNERGTGDFVSIALTDGGYVEYRFNTGSGMLYK